MRWSAAIVAGWGVLLMHSFIASALPPSHWFDVGPRFAVENASVSDPCAPMSADRVIVRDFQATWTVTLLKRNTTSGGYYTYDTFHGGNDYRVGNELPENVDICWWAGVETLQLTPGKYRMNTIWRLDVQGGVREIRRSSNPFIITDGDPAL